jgi:hypothetical protein
MTQSLKEKFIALLPDGTDIIQIIDDGKVSVRVIVEGVLFRYTSPVKQVDYCYEWIYYEVKKFMNDPNKETIKKEFKEYFERINTTP